MNRDGMYDDLIVFLGAFSSGLPGDQGRAFKHRRKSVIRPGDVAFGKDDQRSLGVFEDLDGCLNGPFVHSFAVDRKCAGAAK